MEGRTCRANILRCASSGLVVPTRCSLMVLFACRHHVEDVAAGFCLGLLLAYLHIRQIYAGSMGQHAGMLTAAVRGAGGKGGLTVSPSRFSLLGNGETAEEQPHSGEERV